MRKVGVFRMRRGPGHELPERFVRTIAVAKVDGDNRGFRDPQSVDHLACENQSESAIERLF